MQVVPYLWVGFTRVGVSSCLGIERLLHDRVEKKSMKPDLIKN